MQVWCTWNNASMDRSYKDGVVEYHLHKELHLLLANDNDYYFGIAFLAGCYLHTVASIMLFAYYYSRSIACIRLCHYYYDCLHDYLQSTAWALLCKYLHLIAWYSLLDTCWHLQHNNCMYYLQTTTTTTTTQYSPMTCNMHVGYYFSYLHDTCKYCFLTLA